MQGARCRATMIEGAESRVRGCRGPWRAHSEVEGELDDEGLLGAAERGDVVQPEHITPQARAGGRIRGSIAEPNARAGERGESEQVSAASLAVF